MSNTRRVPFAVVLFLLAFVVASVAAVALARRSPVIESIEPASAAVGEVVTLVGRNFGDAGRVEIDGRPLSEADVHRWSKNVVVFRVSNAVRTGVVQVRTPSGRSNGVFFSNQDTLPVIILGTGEPTITAVTPAPLVVGRPFVISGQGFGAPLATSMVRLIEHERSGEAAFELVPSSSWVVSWTDTRIEALVPPLAELTGLEVSVAGRPAVQAAVSMLSAGAPTVDHEHVRRFAVRQQVALGEIETDLTVWMPRPPVSVAQPEVQLMRESREAIDADGERVIRYAVHRGAFDGTQVVIDRTDLITRVPVRLNVELGAIPPAAALDDATFRRAFAAHLGAESDLPVGHKELVALVAGVRSGSAGAFTVAQRVYDAVVARLQPSIDGHADALIAFREQSANAAGYANLLVAAARTARLPARRYVGFLVLDDGRSVPHSWAELFVPGYGWVSADPALGDGLWENETQSLNEFYGSNRRRTAFGNLDVHRVAIDRDGVLPAARYPAAIILRPTAPYALGAQAVELRSRAAEPEVRWDSPVLVGQF